MTENEIKKIIVDAALTVHRGITRCVNQLEE